MALTQNQQKAIAALLSSPSREDAARKCGLTSRTLRVYFQNDEFCDAYRAAFQELTENATRKAQQLLCPALGNTGGGHAGRGCSLRRQQDKRCADRH